MQELAELVFEQSFRLSGDNFDITFLLEPAEPTDLLQIYIPFVSLSYGYYYNNNKNA